MSDIRTEKITIKRTNLYSLGTRLWFVLQDNKGRNFQRWSLLMDLTDENLMLAKEGDVLDVTYVEEPHSTLDPTIDSNDNKNRIIVAKFTK